MNTLSTLKNIINTLKISKMINTKVTKKKFRVLPYLFFNILNFFDQSSFCSVNKDLSNFN